MISLTELWDKRSLIWYYSLTNMKLRYHGSYLGFLWAALEPLALFIVLYIVFTSLRSSDEDYAIYLMTGIAIYHLFVRGTMGGMSSLLENKSIIQSFPIKRELFPIMSTGTIFLVLLIEIGTLLALMLIVGFEPSWTIILLPIPLLLLLVLILGLSYFLSVFVIFVKDIRPVWAVLVHALLFISPIFWKLDEVDGILLDIYKINPVGQIIELSHQVIFGELTSASDWLYTITFVFSIFIVSYVIFRKFENKIAERI